MRAWRASSGAIVLAGVLAAVADLQGVRADEVIDRVVAVVAGDVIMQSDVNAVRTLGLWSIPREASNDDVIDRLIDRVLVLDEIERYSPPEPSPSAIDDGVQQIVRRFGSREAFEQALARVGYTERRLRQTLRQDFRIDAYVQQRFTTPVPSDGEVVAYFEAHRDEFSIDGRAVNLAEAHDRVVQNIRERRHAALVADWVAGLRRRASIMRVPVSGG